MTTDGERDVVIIGGGIAGIATAYYLAAMGIRSTVIERDGIASHASGFAYGGLSGGVPNGPQVNTPVIEYSMGLYDALAEALTAETDVDIQYQPRSAAAPRPLRRRGRRAHPTPQMAAGAAGLHRRVG